MNNYDTTQTQLKLVFFILLLVFLAAMLVLAPEFVYLRDLFGKRMNTSFKFDHQAWIFGAWSPPLAWQSCLLRGAGFGVGYRAFYFRSC